MASLDGKRIIVTGAATGIGRATALRCAAYGARIAAFDINDTDGRQTVAAITQTGAEARYWRVDVADDSAVAAGVTAAAGWMGGVDALLHVAGIIQATMADIDDVAVETWDRVIDVNLKGSFLMAKHVAGVMKQAGRGVIVLTASGAGVTGGSASIPYAPSKGGVHGLTLVLAMHLASFGIRVNEVCPGKIETPLIAAGRDQVFRHTGRRPAAPAPDGGGSPFLFEGNLGAPEGVAEIYAFLASDQADYVRGSVFTR